MACPAAIPLVKHLPAPVPVVVPRRIFKEPETKPARFQWKREDVIALAKPGCRQCLGIGLRRGRRCDEYAPCGCVLRAIFRACFNRYRRCMTDDRYMSRVRLEHIPGRSCNFHYSRKNEEFCADFYLVAKRTLDPLHWNVFKYHFLLGGDWKLCTRLLSMDRGNFFHSVYRIEQTLGRTFRELKPYALFPVDEYLHGTRKAV
jgi:hypothetical protein